MLEPKEQLKLYLQMLQKKYPEQTELTALLDLIEQDAPKIELMKTLNPLLTTQKLILAGNDANLQEKQKLHLFQCLVRMLEIFEQIDRM